MKGRTSWHSPAAVSQRGRWAAGWAFAATLAALATDLRGEDRRPHVVIAVSEPEYDTRRTLGEFATQELEPRGVACELVAGDPTRHEFPEFAAAVGRADLLVLSIRRQALEADQLQAVRDHVARGRPLIAIRTASHAFDARGAGPPGRAEWPAFDIDVLGVKYEGHYGRQAVVRVAAAAAADGHPLLAGVDLPFSSAGSLYRSRVTGPLVTPLLEGTIPGQPAEAVAWINAAEGRRVFATSLGHPRDFETASFRRLLVNAVSWCLGREGAIAPAAWRTTEVPAAWGPGVDGAASHDGIGWYRAFVTVPETWRGRRLLLVAGRVNDVDEAFFNGTKLGAHGSLPPLYQPPVSRVRRPYEIDADLVRPGEENLVAWRVYGRGAERGIVAGPVLLTDGTDAIDLAGRWEFRTDDVASAAGWPGAADGPASRAAVASYREATGPMCAGHRGTIPFDDAATRRAMADVVAGYRGNRNPHARIDDKGPPRSPADEIAALLAAPDLAIDLVAAEPTVTQPMFTTFDERGRLWAVQYRQYPRPAGLKPLGFDQHLRTIYDRDKPPPPHDPPGADRISIHADGNGDGGFETVTTFVDGLDLCTSVLPGRGGVWVLTPPHLVFYPDADRDDVPDGPPVVHLSGFGIEDTHAVANSLTWGPDGWIYGGQGSTTTARVRTALAPERPAVRFLGQAIWRYHPARHEFEVFAEGGFNTFGVDFDDVGRVYSGSNVAIRGVYFVQGGYYGKNFGKHGPLTNPHALGTLPAMPFTGEKLRMTHQFVIASGTGLPDRYHGRLVAVNPLAREVVVSRLERDGSAMATVDEFKAVTSGDPWFRPVHAALGPDGAVYLADWYDARITHLDPADTWDRLHGRILRLRRRDGWQPARPRDLAALDTQQLVALLGAPDRWHRDMARRLLGDRAARDAAPTLRGMLTEGDPSAALEALWALEVVGAITDADLLAALHHRDPHVRRWGVRLLGDRRNVPSTALAAALESLARDEREPEVRCQLAASLRRLPPATALPALAALVGGPGAADDAADPFIPLMLWWAVERIASDDPSAVTALVEAPGVLAAPAFVDVVLPRLVQRLLAEEGRAAQFTVAGIFARAAPVAAARDRAFEGVGEALRARPTIVLEPEVAAVLGGADRPPREMSVAQLVTAARRRLAPAVDELVRLAGPDADGADRERRLVAARVLGELAEPAGLAALLATAAREPDDAVRGAAIRALGGFADDRVSDLLTAAHAGWGAADRAMACDVLLQRPAWIDRLLAAVEAGTIPRDTLRPEEIARIRNCGVAAIVTRANRLFGAGPRPTSAERQHRIETLGRVLADGTGDASRGRELYATSCARCHRMLDGSGGADIGPNLATMKRDDVGALLLAIVDPSAGIHEDWVATVVTTADGRALTGFVTDRGAAGITLRDLTGASVTIAAADIDDETTLPVSPMPEGLLDGLSDAAVRDLFAYLTPATGPTNGGEVAPRPDPVLVFIFAGQSNIVGRADPRDVPAAYREPLPNVRLFANRSWRELAVPTRGEDGIGPEISAARLLAEASPGRKIVIVKTAVGGTNLHTQWNPDRPGSLYARMLDDLKTATAGAAFEVGAVFWGQGGSDAKEAAPARAYGANLAAFVARTRRDLGRPDLPFLFSGTAADAPVARRDASPFMADVIRGRIEVSKTVPRTALVPTNGLPLLPDRMHYDMAGTIELGRRFVAAWERNFHRAAAAP